MYFMRQTIIVMSRLIEYDMRKEIFEHYLTMDLSFYKRNKTGDLMSRLTEDVNKVRMYLGPVLLYGFNLITLFVIVIVTMFKVNFWLSVYTLMPLPILSLIIYWVSNKIHSRSEHIQRQLAKLTNLAQESFSGIRIIKSYAVEDQWKQKMDEEANQYRNLTLQLTKIDAMFFPSMILLIGLSTLITIYVGGLDVYNGSVTAGNIAEFIIYVNMLTWPVSAIGWCASLIQQADASQKRLNEFLSQSPQIKSGLIENPTTIRGDIQFKNVDFYYEESGIKALDNINISINRGERIAVVGRTASGKTSFTELLLRIFDPQSGEITLDGKDLRSYDLTYLRSQFAYVPQDVFLFSDTIAANISFGKELPDSGELRLLSQQSGIEQEIEEMPEGMQTLIGERGVSLSGGQKQRISIARALMRNSPVLLLDDCLSAVDNQTEQKIMEELSSTKNDKTIILITHRMMQTKYMDRILVFDHGQIVEEGNFEELMSLNGAFAKLYTFETQQEEV